MLADVNIKVDPNPLSVAEPSVLNEVGADKINIDGWVLSGSGSAQITITISNPEAGQLMYGATEVANNHTRSFVDADSAQEWLNSLTFQAAGTELGNTAIAVTITVSVNSNSASRTITITPSNDPVVVVDTTISVTEGSTGTVIKLVADDPEVALGAQTTEQIVYNLTKGPEYGDLFLLQEGGERQRLGDGSIFTQKDIDEGRLVYVHTSTGDDQNKEDSFEVRVNDGATPIDDSGTAKITLNILPVNQLPTIGGSGIVYEGQPNNAEGTGNVGQYIDASTGGDPQDSLEAMVVTLKSLTDAGAGGALYFTGEATVGGVTQQYTNHEITQQNIDDGFSFAYSAKDGLTYEHDGQEGIFTDQFTVSVTDQGGGTGTVGHNVGGSIAIKLEIRPVDDDPILGKEGGHNPSLEAAIAGNGNWVIPITPDMLGAHDIDTDPKNISFIVSYDDSDMNQGLLQIKIGDTWYTLPNGSAFSMADITAEKIRYIQTANANPGDIDEFTFQVVDNTMALRWDTEGSAYSRVGGIYEDPSDSLSALKDHTFTIYLAETQTGAGDDGTVYAPYSNEASEDLGYAGIKHDLSGSRGQLIEDDPTKGKIFLQGTPEKGNPSAPYLSYTVTHIEADEIVYTFMGFSNENGSSDNAGWLTKSGNPLNMYDTFTQADLDAGNVIQFHHDGDSEKFVTTAKFSVSAGLMKNDGGRWYPIPGIPNLPSTSPQAMMRL